MERVHFDWTGPTERSGPLPKVHWYFGTFAGWTEPVHSVLHRNFRIFGTGPIVPLMTLSKPWGVLPEKLGGRVRPTSQNPYPIYDQNLPFLLPDFIT